MKIPLLLLLLFFPAIEGISAPLPVAFTTITSLEGLPQNTARVLLQDRNGYIWIGTEDGLVRFDGYDMDPFRKKYGDPETLSDNYISALVEGHDGQIWVGTLGGGLNSIDPKTGKVHHLEQLGTSDIFAIVQEPDSDTLWVGTDSGLYQINFSRVAAEEGGVEGNLVSVPLVLEDGSAITSRVSGIVLQGDDLWFVTRGYGIGRYHLKEKGQDWFVSGNMGLEDNVFNTLVSDGQGRIWAGGQNRGLVHIIQQGDAVAFQHYNTENSGLKSNDVMAIADAGGGKFWVGTWGGLVLLDPVDGRVEQYRSQVDDSYSFKSDIVMDILLGHDGQVWVGTFDRGVSWFDPDPPFRTFRARPDEAGGLPGNLIWSFAEQSDGRIWIGTSEGLARLNLKSNEYEPPEAVYPVDLWSDVVKDDIRALFMDGSILWIAARHAGLVRLDLSSGRLTPITELLAPGQVLSHPYIRLIQKDSQGYLWFGATKGLNRFDPKSGENRVYMPDSDGSLSLPHYRLRALYADGKGQMWAGTSEGLLLINSEGDPVKVWRYDPSGSELLAGRGVRAVSEDPLGRLWIATEGGISIFDKKNATIKILREEDGLPSNAAYSVLSSGDSMWVSTLRGIARINVNSLYVEKYFNSDGLPDNEFNFNAWKKLSDGRLLFGTLSGFTLFSPQEVPGPEHPAVVPPLYLQAYVTLGEKNRVPLSVGEKAIELGWQDNQIEFSYGALNYQAHGAVSYESTLKGAGREWSSVGKQRQVSYSALAPGRYIFQVRAVDRHGQWQVDTDPISFIIAAPPWRTPLAIAGYVVLATGFLFWGSFLYNRGLRNRAKKLQLLVAERTVELEVSGLDLEEKNKQLDHLLTIRERLFRAVSHEIRTPLTVISSVLESLQSSDPGAGEKVPMAQQSARRLGHLLDSILDLSRHGGQLQADGPFSVKPALTEAITPYILQAEMEDKIFTFEGRNSDAWLALPRETFVMMVSNLLSNACKYTQEGDTILVQAGEDGTSFVVRVEDSGCGIPATMEEQVFEWFNRGGKTTEKEGWGIGLAFVREAAEAAAGTIQVQVPATGIGAQFVLTLPLAEQVFSEEKIGEVVQDLGVNKDIIESIEKSRTLLFIEDDPDLLELLPTLFPESWNCLTVDSAEKGWTVVCEVVPDLVITDLMLPGESGFDFTAKLKEDFRTAHIPVIILTALGGEEQRLTGLGLSADSFMEKPFDNRELLLKVQGLIANRERVYQRVKCQLTGLAPEEQEEKSLVGEDGFLESLQAAFPGSTELVSASLEDVAGRLAMSRRSVQREMQRIGISWREYKRLRQLRMAMDLLRNPAHRVGMVAEQAGYNSAAHFSKIFKQHTGSSPTEWRRIQKQTGS